MAEKNAGIWNVLPGKQSVLRDSALEHSNLGRKGSTAGSAIRH